ncbi:MAG: AraC family transcriptional regulator [Acidimicrobiales bacterium]
MSVSASQDKNLSLPVTVDLIDLRVDAAIRAGSFHWDGPDVVTGWHRHPYHQLEYALAGVAEVQTLTGQYLLPPQQAIWIPAQLPHVTTLRQVNSISVFFDPRVAVSPDQRARVLTAAPLIREMLVYSVRWPIARTDHDPAADRFFETLAHIVFDWLGQETPLWLPTTTDSLVAEVTAHIDAHLSTVTAADACRAIGVSERTLRRRFASCLGMSWSSYLKQCRVLRAMAMLAEDDDVSVLDTATAVGFQSPTSLTRAFRDLLGETPSTYRARVREPITRAAPL